MNQYLFYGRFKWLNQKDIDKFDVNSIKCNSIHECILELDLEYSDKLHRMHNDNPLAPEKLKLIMIYCQTIVVILQIDMI